MYLRAKKAPKTRKDKNNNKNLKFLISKPNNILTYKQNMASFCLKCLIFFNTLIINKFFYKFNVFNILI